MPLSNKPAISVLMSVYNGQRWLPDSIESVLNQTLSDFEFIIVNDGSIDQSLSTLNSYASRDRRIRVFNKSNTGLADSLNIGISSARGDWIARIDADDISLPTRLQKQWEASTSRPSLVLLGTGLTLIDELSLKGLVYHYPSSHPKLVRRLERAEAFFAHSSAFFNTAAARRCGGYRTRIRRAQDRDLWLRLSEVGNISCITEPLVEIRKHSDQISHDEDGKRQLQDSHVAMISYWVRKLGGEDPVDVFLDEEFDYFYNWVKGRIRQSGLFQSLDFKMKLSKSLMPLKRRRERLGVLFFEAAKHPKLLAQTVTEKVMGSNLPLRLATEWVRHLERKK